VRGTPAGCEIQVYQFEAKADQQRLEQCDQLVTQGSGHSPEAPATGVPVAEKAKQKKRANRAHKKKSP
jgi:hypothetical protein